ncbi:hypothetical protein [Aegicerativicinus sediminis]|uniref:hypothetical protein n=1 Tax=Aegicerativicinus sediminis TaxID=2893202 RepID=UPI001E573E14|nr:hypothetical protein [Aegicerativicinus sediminis]
MNNLLGFGRLAVNAKLAGNFPLKKIRMNDATTKVKGLYSSDQEETYPYYHVEYLLI